MESGTWAEIVELGAGCALSSAAQFNRERKSLTEIIPAKERATIKESS